MARSGCLGGAAAAELRRHAASLVLAVILVVASVIAVALPGWGLSATAEVAGGSSVELAATVADGSEARAADVAQAARLVAERAKACGKPEVQARAQGTSVVLSAPAGEDVSSLAGTLAATGSVEFVRSDAIADADALAQMQAGSKGVGLTSGMYEAFSDGSHVRSASARTLTSKNPKTGVATTTWVVDVTLDDEGASAFSEATGDLASVRGQIAVVVDGKVVAAPSVSTRLSGNRIMISGGLTQDSARELAATLKSGALPVTLAASGDAASVTPVLGAAWALVAAGAAALVAAAVVAGLVRRPLLPMYVVPLVCFLPLVAGGLALLSHARLLAVGTASLAGVAAGFVCLLGLLVLADLTFRSAYAKTARLRKAAASAAAGSLLPAVCVAAAACAVGAAGWAWAPFELAQAALALSVGGVAACACTLLLAGPILRTLAYGSLVDKASALAPAHAREGSGE